ncbi:MULTISPECIES: P22 phage major capsid protein family protein [unclassified Curtobacterium]|uniref:P22 phage major capsid protein family protein n=1 Tax=unclassified Curtobacterium TaxID=257496 RepID=UPI0010D2EE0E|nr:MULTISPECIES: P22 phage major capsid protein family protein [unclassified Curtobacterium]TDW69170.1 P22 coat protein Gp5 [Curtobacterium sp. PhB25]WIB69795.1 P22 phage major capsid protein family protein [Curtobacterium sp. MCBD17_026]
MADNNIFIKGTKFAQTALALLRKTIKAPGLFTTKYGVADFRGAEGDTIGVKRPVVLAARRKPWRGDDEIIIDKLVNTKIQVTLDQHVYSAVELSPEEETLDEVDYVRDVQAPQVDAVARDVASIVVAALTGATFVNSVKFNPNSADPRESDPRKVALRARNLFQKAFVPTTGRYWLVGADISEAIAGHEKLLDVDTAGIPEALRDGVVGRLGGFTIVELDELAPTASFFTHESAIAWVVVAPVVPNGVAKGGGVAAGNGIAVTQLWDYDSKRLKDRSIVHAFAGSTPVLDPKLKDDGTLDLDADNAPKLQFVRAIKVTYSTTAPAAS